MLTCFSCPPFSGRLHFYSEPDGSQVVATFFEDSPDSGRRRPLVWAKSSQRPDRRFFTPAKPRLTRIFPSPRPFEAVNHSQRPDRWPFAPAEKRDFCVYGFLLKSTRGMAGFFQKTIDKNGKPEGLNRCLVCVLPPSGGLMLFEPRRSIAARNEGNTEKPETATVYKNSRKAKKQKGERLQ